MGSAILRKDSFYWRGGPSANLAGAAQNTAVGGRERVLQRARWKWMKMPPKTIKSAIKDSLENLERQNLAKFCSALLDRREEPRVPVRRVEDKDFLGVTDVLVSTFGEGEAARVTLELLKEIQCVDVAETFGEICYVKYCVKKRQHLNETTFFFYFCFHFYGSSHCGKNLNLSLFRHSNF